MSSTDRISGLKTSVAIKAPALVATTANITLSGEQTIDGVAVVAGNRVLVKDQTDTTENGVYDVSAGAWTRAIDFNSSSEIVEGTEILSVDGTANSGRRWYISTSSPAIGSALAFAQVTTPSSGAEPSDGDKGDITVSGSGLSWNINDGDYGDITVSAGVWSFTPDDSAAALSTLGGVPLAGGALTGGFTTTADNDGTQSSGTYTPTPTGGNMKRIVNGGAFTFAPPSAAGDYTLVVEITNNASAGTITWDAGWTNVVGSVDATDTNKFHVYITKLNGSTLASITALQ